MAKRSDITIIMAGLPDEYESEGFDREHMRLPKQVHAAIVDAVLLFSRLPPSGLTLNITIIMAGLPDEYESEGFDREHMRLPKQVHAAIVDAVFIFSRLPPSDITLRYHNHHGGAAG
jgi:hypothetical protein